MIADDDDPYAELKRHVLPPDYVPAVKVSVPDKIKKRRQQFIMVPWTWAEKLLGVKNPTAYSVAILLLHLHWRRKGEPIKLANKTVEFEGISRQSKWRALRELEQRGLISVECRPRRSPIVRLNMPQG